MSVDIALAPTPTLEAEVDFAPLRGDYPEIYAKLSGRRAAALGNAIAGLDDRSWEFEGLDSGGRGEAYNKAQIDPGGRSTGMLALLRLFSPSFEALPPPDWTLLDVLGGDGTLARLAKRHGLDCRIVSADIAGLMVAAALANGLPAIRQAAGASLFRDDTLDGILIGYGTHHLGDRERDDALVEAYRTLKPGRRVVLHDFEEGGPVARWFAEVVHPYSRTGHPHPHFTRSELMDRFRRAGFAKIRVMEIADPFTIHGKTAEAARVGLAEHLYWMYDLVKLATPTDGTLLALAESILGPVTVAKGPAGYSASVPRRALLGVGTK
jgi:SAM-dependent methyltransferase